MSEEVSLKELLGEAVRETKEQTKDDDGGISMKDIMQIIKAVRELQQPQAQANPPAQPKGGKSPEEKANIIWNYMVEVINQLAKMYPDMTVKEVAEKLPELEHVAKPQLQNVAKSL